VKAATVAPDSDSPALIRSAPTKSAPRPARLVAVLDMGASAIRLVIAEIGADGSIRVVEEASRGILLGRDTFSAGVIPARTIDATLAALEGFQHLIDSYGVKEVRAVATSAVREAQNGDVLLDRIQGRTGIAFQTINEAEESRLLYLAVHRDLGTTPEFRGPWTMLAEVGGGSTSLTLLRKGRPNRSGVYALGAVRLRQRMDLRGLSHDLQLSLERRSIANLIAEIRLEVPLQRVTHLIAIGGDVRFAASQILEEEIDGEPRRIPRAAFLEFCERLAPMDEEDLSTQFRLPAAEAETLVPALLIYYALVCESSAEHILVSDASLRSGLLLDMASPGGRLGARDFEQQVLASAEAVGHRYRFDRAHGQHVADLAVRLFNECQDEHRLSDRDRLLLKVAALLHDIGVYVSLRAHHKHSLYLLQYSQIFGLTNDEMTIVANIARYHRGQMPQRSHQNYMALERRDRLMVSKLAAFLRLANALDAEHLQKVTGVTVARHGRGWVLTISGRGDLTMERLAASARADLLRDAFGGDVVLHQAVVPA
jgi:exopolyphosphatase / guanosine-5'-triphosphate,3'-diphosphate pyrophosphatase